MSDFQKLGIRRHSKWWQSSPCHLWPWYNIIYAHLFVSFNNTVITQIEIHLSHQLKLISAMKTEISYGSEVQDSHFNRSAVPDQGWLLHSMNEDEQLIKSTWHYFGSDASKSNWSYTLCCLNQFLSDLPEASIINVNELQKLVFIRYYSF